MRCIECYEPAEYIFGRDSYCEECVKIEKETLSLKSRENYKKLEEKQ